MLTPLAHQKHLLERNPDRELLAWGTGTGKSYGMLWIAKQKGLPALILAKKDLKKKWERDAALILGGEWLVLTKEEFVRALNVDRGGRVRSCAIKVYPTVLVDEAHYFAGMTSAMSAKLLAYIGLGVRHVYLGTATPYLSTPWNIFRLAQLLGRRWPYGKFRTAFFDRRLLRLACKRRLGSGEAACGGCRMCRREIWEPKKGIEEDIAKIVRNLGSVVRLDECADVPEQTYRTIRVPLTAEQVRAKKAVMEVNPAVRHMLRHRIECGHSKGDGYVPDAFYESNAVARTLEFGREFKKLFVVCHYNLQIDHLKREFEAAGRKVFVIRGDVKDRDTVVREAEASDDCILLVQAACSEGYETPSFPAMVFASMSFKYKDFEQMHGRILRVNALKKNLYVYLVPDGVSAGVHEAMLRKEDFDIAIYARQNPEA